VQFSIVFLIPFYNFHHLHIHGTWKKLPPFLASTNQIKWLDLSECFCLNEFYEFDISGGFYEFTTKNVLISGGFFEAVYLNPRRWERYPRLLFTSSFNNVKNLFCHRRKLLSPFAANASFSSAASLLLSPFAASFPPPQGNISILLSRFSSPASHSFTRILNFSILFNLYDLFECDISLIDFVQFPV
jgi:hypothetical protein